MKKARVICAGTALILLLQVTFCRAGEPPIGGAPQPAEGIGSGRAPAGGLHLYADGAPPVPPGKDPFIAGLLSWFMLGVGQIYAKEYTKGSLFIAAGLVDKLALILLISHINSTYGSKEEIVYVDWQAFDSSTRALIITYLAGSLGLRAFCAIDAVHSAKKFNQRFYTREERGLSLSLDEDIRVQYHIRFSD
jgi:hypothetical protein